MPVFWSDLGHEGKSEEKVLQMAFEKLAILEKSYPDPSLLTCSGMIAIIPELVQFRQSFFEIDLRRR